MGSKSVRSRGPKFDTPADRIDFRHRQISFKMGGVVQIALPFGAGEGHAVGLIGQQIRHLHAQNFAFRSVIRRGRVVF